MKLDASEYRAIILNLQANTKQAHRLRQIACEDSFAARAMPNLDRLVGSVVKEHVSFVDLIQVAVGMVNEETTASADSERNKLLLKQTESEITDWIKNRRACEDDAEKVLVTRGEPVDAFVDFDPTGLSIAASLLRLAHLILPDERWIISAIRERKRYDLYGAQIGVHGAKFAASTHPDVVLSLALLKQLRQGYTQEWMESASTTRRFD